MPVPSQGPDLRSGQRLRAPQLELNIAQRQLVDTRQQLDQTQRLMQQTQVQIADLQQQLAEWQEGYHALGQRYQYLEQQHEQLQAVYEQLQISHQELADAHKSLQQLQQLCHEQLSDAQQEAADAAAAAQQLHLRVGALQENLGDDFGQELKYLLERDKHKDTTLECNRTKVQTCKAEMQELNREGRVVLWKLKKLYSNTWPDMLQQLVPQQDRLPEVVSRREE